MVWGQGVEVLAPAGAEEAAGAGGACPRRRSCGRPGQTYTCPRQQLRLRQRTTEKREGEVTLTVLVYRAEGASVSRAPAGDCTSNPQRGRW